MTLHQSDDPSHAEVGTLDTIDIEFTKQLPRTRALSSETHEAWIRSVIGPLPPQKLAQPQFWLFRSDFDELPSNLFLLPLFFSISTTCVRSRLVGWYPWRPDSNHELAYCDGLVVALREQHISSL